MRRLFFGVVTVVVIAGLGIYGFMAYRKPLPVVASRVAVSTKPTNIDPSLSWPATGEAAVGAGGYGVLAVHGVQAPTPTASVAKIMTALAVLKAHPLAAGAQGPTLIMTAADVASFGAYLDEDGSVAKVTLGEKLTEYQALEAMLLPSADNIADTLAEWSYGSISAYSVIANSMAQSLGMTNTHFGTADASGYSPQTVSTAHDLVLLGQAALQNPVIAEIVAKPATTIPVSGTIHNVNWLLGSNGINGIKTGNTDQAGGVFLFSAKKTLANGQTVTVIGAVMQPSATLFQALNSTVPLLKSAQSNFALTTLVHTGDVMATYSVAWAGTVNATATKSLTAITWRSQNIAPKVRLNPLRAPVAAGTQVGTAAFSITHQSVPIVINQPIATPSWRWRLQHAF